MVDTFLTVVIGIVLLAFTFAMVGFWQVPNAQRM